MGSSAPPCHTLAWGQIVPLKHIRLRQHGTLRLCSVFPRSARKNRTPIGLTQLLHPASQSDIFACGSMVRSDHMFVVFCARRAQKTTNEEMASTALPKAQTTNCVSPINYTSYVVAASIEAHCHVERSSTPSPRIAA